MMMRPASSAGMSRRGGALTREAPRTWIKTKRVKAMSRLIVAGER